MNTLKVTFETSENGEGTGRIRSTEKEDIGGSEDRFEPIKCFLREEYRTCNESPWLILSWRPSDRINLSSYEWKLWIQKHNDSDSHIITEIPSDKVKEESLRLRIIFDESIFIQILSFFSFFNNQNSSKFTSKAVWNLLFMADVLLKFSKQWGNIGSNYILV